MKTYRGLIIRSQSGFYWVQLEPGQGLSGVLVSQLRGRLKQGPREGDVAAIGDWVKVTPVGEESGVIEEIEPRKSMISRQAPNPQIEYRQIIIANPDQAFLVFACEKPAPRFGMLDRFLVINEKQGIPSLIIANKVDLVGLERAQELFGVYAGLGYPVLYTSVKTGLGIETLRQHLKDKISVFTGPSGVGKSSLLNTIQPGLGLAARQVSAATSKGRHTTVARELFPLQGGGYVADTPGLKALALWDIEPEEIDGYFPEMRDEVAKCQFSDCTHVHEPGCGVLAAIAAGKIHPDRYQSYLRMRFGDEE